MKKTVLAASAVAVALLCGCGNTTQTTPPPTTDTDNTQEQPVANEMANMSQPIDALLQTMLVEKTVYSPEDNDFFWDALTLFAAGYGGEHQLATETDNAIEMPSQAVQEFASVLFSDYDDLLPLPENYENAAYDEAYDQYVFSKIELVDTTVDLTLLSAENGVYEVEATMKNNLLDKKVGTWLVTMIDNPYADGITNPTYLYSIASIEPTEQQSSTSSFVETLTWTGLDEDGNFLGKTEDGDDVVYSIDSQVRNMLQNNFKEGDAITMVVEVNALTGGREISSIDAKK